MFTDKELVVLVDDDITNLNVARNNLAQGYQIATAPSGEKLFRLLEKVTPALILLDIEMPVMDGFTIMTKLKEDKKTAHIPIILLTSRTDPKSEVKGLSLGAVDYITKPFSRELIIKRIEIHLLLEKQRKELLKHNHSLESELEKKARTVVELQNVILKTISELIEYRDGITGGHIERIQNYLSFLMDCLVVHGAYEKELSSWDSSLFVLSSQLHDVGKISIRDGILLKPGKLTAQEFDEMKKHTDYGVEIITRIAEKTTDNEFLQYAKVLAGSHHEKWNGSGYPHHLSGEDIPLMGRLMALVDVYDALTNVRPYKEAFSHDKAVNIIKRERGIHFDPLIVDVFLMHEREFLDHVINALYMHSI